MRGKTEQEENPSIESPKEIVNAGRYNAETEKYEVDIKINGKNMISELTRGSINISNGAIMKGDNFINKEMMPCLSGKYLVLSANSRKYTLKQVCYYDKNKNFVKTDQSWQPQIPEGIHYCNFEILNTDLKETENAMLEMQDKNGEQTAYEAYKEPQTLTIPLGRPLAKWDRIEKRDGVWGVAYKSNKVVFDGSKDEYWYIQSDSNGNCQFYTRIDNCPIENIPSFINNFYCDKFIKTSTSGTINIGMVRYGIFGNSFAPVFKPDHEITALSSWRDFLLKNQITVQYITDSEEFVPLPEETQIPLNSLHTNYPTTIISNSEDCEMEVEYIADTKNYIDKKFAELSASIVATQKALL